MQNLNRLLCLFLVHICCILLLYSLNAKYFLQSAKITGFGGILDNKTKAEQTFSCFVKEGIVKVSVLWLF